MGYGENRNVHSGFTKHVEFLGHVSDYELVKKGSTPWSYSLNFRKIAFWLGIPKVRDRWEDNIKMDLRKTGIDGFSWLRIGSGGGLLCTG
jgi:hypothetical protein